MMLKDLEELPREYLLPAEVADVLGMHPQEIRDHIHTSIAKHERPYEFPVITVGNRIKIPKLAFIKYMKGEMQPCQEPK
jgi:hypothetical protein